MAYVKPGSTAKRHAVDAMEAAQIAAAVSYVVHFRKGPFETYRETAATLDCAHAIETRMNAEHGKHGRRACIYAVTAEGKHLPIPATA